MDVNMVFMI
jgi:hypothetical protein